MKSLFKRRKLEEETEFKPPPPPDPDEIKRVVARLKEIQEAKTMPPKPTRMSKFKKLFSFDRRRDSGLNNIDDPAAAPATTTPNEDVGQYHDLASVTEEKDAGQYHNVKTVKKKKVTFDLGPDDRDDPDDPNKDYGSIAPLHDAPADPSYTNSSVPHDPDEGYGSIASLHGKPAAPDNASQSGAPSEPTEEEKQRAQSEAKARKYNNVLKEFKNTEKAFSTDIQAIIKLDLERLAQIYEQEKNPGDFASIDDLKALVSATEKLAVAERYFKEALDKDDFQACQHAFPGYANAYLEYQRQFQKVHIGHSGTVLPQAFKDEFMNKHHDLDPAAFIIKPVQRFTKLPMLVRDLISSGTDITQNTNLQVLLDRALTTLNLANEIQDSAEITRELDNLSSVKPKDLPKAVSATLNEYMNHSNNLKINANDERAIMRVNLVCSHEGFQEILANLSKSQSKQIDKALQEAGIILNLDQIKQQMANQKSMHDQRPPLQPSEQAIGQGEPITRYTAEQRAQQLTLLSMLIDLSGQKERRDCFELLLKSPNTIMTEFFKIHGAFKDSKRSPADYQKLSFEMQIFFQKHGLDLGALGQIKDYTQLEPMLKHNLDNQILLYLFSDLKQNYDIAPDGTLSRHKDLSYEGLQAWEQNLDSVYQALESVGFSAVATQRVKLGINFTEETSILVAGAKKGDIDSRVALATKYISALVNDINEQEPKLPEGVSIEDIKNWIVEFRENGHSDGLSRLYNFLDNVMLLAVHLNELDRPYEQRQRIAGLIELAKEISADPILNDYLDTFKQLAPNFKAEMKEHVKEARDYILGDYQNQFNLTAPRLASMAVSGNQLDLGQGDLTAGEFKYNLLMELLKSNASTQSRANTYKDLMTDAELQQFVRDNPEKRQALLTQLEHRDNRGLPWVEVSHLFRSNVTALDDTQLQHQVTFKSRVEQPIWSMPNTSLAVTPAPKDKASFAKALSSHHDAINHVVAIGRYDFHQAIESEDRAANPNDPSADRFPDPDFPDYFSGKVVGHAGRIITYEVEMDGQTKFIHHFPLKNKGVARLTPEESDYLASIQKSCQKEKSRMLVHCKGGTGRTGALITGLLANEPAYSGLSYDEAVDLYAFQRAQIGFGAGLEEKSQRADAKTNFERLRGTEATGFTPYVDPEFAETYQHVQAKIQDSQNQLLSQTGLNKVKVTENTAVLLYTLTDNFPDNPGMITDAINVIVKSYKLDPQEYGLSGDVATVQVLDQNNDPIKLTININDLKTLMALSKLNEQLFECQSAHEIRVLETRVRRQVVSLEASGAIERMISNDHYNPIHRNITQVLSGKDLDSFTKGSGRTLNDKQIKDIAAQISVEMAKSPEDIFTWILSSIQLASEQDQLVLLKNSIPFIESFIASCPNHEAILTEDFAQGFKELHAFASKTDSELAGTLKSSYENEMKSLSVRTVSAAVFNGSVPDIKQGSTEQWWQQLDSASTSSKARAALAQDVASDLSNQAAKQFAQISGDNLEETIGKAVAFSSKVTASVVEDVLGASNAKQLRSIAGFYIEVAHACLEKGDFQSAFSIMSGLNDASVLRFFKSGDDLDPKLFTKAQAKQLKALIPLCELEGSFAAYRKAVAAHPGPVIPALNVLLKDATIRNEIPKTITAEDGTKHKNSDYQAFEGQALRAFNQQKNDLVQRFKPAPPKTGFTGRTQQPHLKDPYILSTQIMPRNVEGAKPFKQTSPQTPTRQQMLNHEKIHRAKASAEGKTLRLKTPNDVKNLAQLLGNMTSSAGRMYFGNYRQAKASLDAMRQNPSQTMEEAMQRLERIKDIFDIFVENIGDQSELNEKQRKSIKQAQTILEAAVNQPALIAEGPSNAPAARDEAAIDSPAPTGQEVPSQPSSDARERVDVKAPEIPSATASAPVAGADAPVSERIEETDNLLNQLKEETTPDADYDILAELDKMELPEAKADPTRQGPSPQAERQERQERQKMALAMFNQYNRPQAQAESAPLPEAPAAAGAGPSDLPAPPDVSTLPPALVAFDESNQQQLKQGLEALNAQCSELNKANDNGFAPKGTLSFVGNRNDKINYRAEKGKLLTQVSEAIDKMLDSLANNKLTIKDCDEFMKTIEQVAGTDKILNNLANTLNQNGPVAQVLTQATELAKAHIEPNLPKADRPKSEGPSGLR